MKEWDLNTRDYMGSVALTWVSDRGHKEVMKMLLEREGVNRDQANTIYGLTPLLWAAKRGH